MKRSEHTRSAGAANQAGFTLIELVVVIVIVAILAAIAIPVFFSQREKAFRAQVVSGLRNGGTIMQAWGTQNGGDYTVPHGVGEAATADMTWMTGDGWPPTEGVEIDIVEADATGFCLHGTHNSLGTVSMEYRSGAGGPQDGDCT